MTHPQFTEAYQWRGSTVVDRNGEKIGKVDEVYADQEGGQPEWALVHTGLLGGTGNFVPPVNASPLREDVQVPFEKGRVKDSPAVEADRGLSEDAERRLFEHYGVRDTNEGSVTASSGGAADSRHRGGFSMSATQSVPVQPGGEPSATQQKAQEAAGQAQEKAQQAAGQAKDKLRQQVDQRSTQAGEQAGTAAQDLRGVADHLRSQGKDQPAKLAEQAAQRVEKVGGYLQQSDSDRILSDVEDFGRQKPWAVAAAGAALGFAASRLLKASSSERYRATSSSRSGMV